MFQRKSFPKFLHLVFPFLFIFVIAGCNAQQPAPVKPDEISEPTMAKYVSHAEAWNLIYVPWPTEGGEVSGAFVEGPFKGFKIVTDENGALTGYRIYVHRTQGYFSPKDIEAHYERKLVAEWYGEDKWQRLEECSTSDHCWAWKRGKQVFIVVCAKKDSIRIFHTYLISK